jgi:hypothetical protein
VSLLAWMSGSAAAAVVEVRHSRDQSGLACLCSDIARKSISLSRGLVDLVGGARWFVTLVILVSQTSGGWRVHAQPAKNFEVW